MEDFNKSKIYNIVDRFNILKIIIGKLGIKFKLIFSIAVTLILIITLFSYIALKLEERNLKKTTDVLCKTISDQLISTVESSILQERLNAKLTKGSEKRMAWILQDNLLSLKNMKIHGLVSVGVIDTKGIIGGKRYKKRYIAHFNKKLDRRRVKNYRKLKKINFSGEFEIIIKADNKKINVIQYFFPLYFLQKEVGAVELNFSKDVIMEPLKKARFWFSIVGLGAIIFMIPIVYFLGTRITRPVRYLSDKTNLAAEGDLDVKIESLTHDEIGSLSFNFKKMLRAIKKQQKELVEKERMEEELKIARDIQETLLPQSLPEINGVIFHVYFKSHSEASGDFYDFMKLNDTEVALLIADVSGHGVGAGLVMAMTRATLRTHARNEHSPEKLLKIVNPSVHEDTLSSMFVTMFYGVLNIKTKILKYSSAGHNQGIIFNLTAAKIRILKTGGIPLGAADADTFDPLCELNRTALKEGDIFLQYTDGITEAMNSQGEEFGEDRLINAIKRSRAKDSKELIDFVIADLNQFLGKSKLDDDITLISFKIV